MDSFHIWYKWSLAWEGVSDVMTFDLDLYLQGHSALFWLGIQHDSIVWVITRRRGYPQNAGVLVVLVFFTMIYHLFLLNVALSFPQSGECIMLRCFIWYIRHHSYIVRYVVVPPWKYLWYESLDPHYVGYIAYYKRFSMCLAIRVDMLCCNAP